MPRQALVHQFSGFLDLFTPQTVEMYNAALKGDVARARKLWQWLLPFKHLYSHQILAWINDIAIYRAGLETLGEVGGYSRPPLYSLAPVPRAVLQELMEKHRYVA